MSPKAVSDSRVSFYEIIHQEHCSDLSVCRASFLLRWMDICACLSAERHADLSSVTLSLDELTFDVPIKAGTAIEIRANVNNAFNTSVEVCCTVVSTEGLNAEVVTVHCRSHFTFVSLDHNGQKDKVPMIIPETEYERDCFVMAKERRALRFKRKDMIKSVTGRIKSGEMKEARGSLTRLPSGSLSMSASPPAPLLSLPSKKGGGGVALGLFSMPTLSSTSPPPAPTPAAPQQELSKPMTASAIQMTKLVLPSDANHMNNVFGGVIMSWMDDACTIAASKHVAGFGLNVVLTTIVRTLRTKIGNKSARPPPLTT